MDSVTYIHPRFKMVWTIAYLQFGREGRNYLVIGQVKARIVSIRKIKKKLIILSRLTTLISLFQQFKSF
jgi:hypothetical protein